MIHDDTAATVYAAVAEFRQQCLVDRRSIGQPDLSGVWSVESAQELIDRFIESADLSKRSFIEKLRDQLSDVSEPALQLLVDLTWLHLSISKFYKPETKRRIMAEIAEIKAGQLPRGVFDEAMETGVAYTGTSFVTRRPNQLWLLIRFAHGWLEASAAENERLLADPWALRAFVFGLEGVADQSQRHALIHLLHPETFEDIVSQYHKRDLVETFLDGPRGDNIDRDLTTVRAQLTQTYGEGFSFYQPDVHALWSGEEESAKPVETESDQAEERAVVDPRDGQRAWLLRGQGGDLVPSWLERGIGSVEFDDVFPFPIESGATRDELRSLAEEHGVDTTSGGFNNYLGQVWRFVNAIEIGDYVVTVNGDQVYLGQVESGPVNVGGRARRETTRRIEWLNAERPVPRTLVSPSLFSKLRTLLTLTNITSTIPELDQWANEKFPTAEDAAVETAELQLAPPTKELAESLLMPQPWLAELVEMLFEKKQLTLYGPPGTGKTYLAQAIADHLTQAGGTSELVQFHPSYTYEDFFEGYRPVQGVGGNVSFELKPGPLRRIAEVATREPTVPHVLIIDEINRANLAKVFGELYFLLEYRSRFITLQYSDEEFSLPDNLYIIGTMNTADRSIALVDAAMRRRFYFVGMAPDVEPVDGLLRRWLEKEGLDQVAADVLDELNRRIGDPDGAIGPSFFMTAGIDSMTKLRRVWDASIAPLLQERFYGTANEDSGEFTLGSILAALRASSEHADVE